ncbi:ComEA family DNA-binding protein [Clostridium sp. C8-1-8]|uniref:ComEA family DNA-binding protein n=1 Tax=Clostridium sp. C8-1-8 TaxID=2698831 RepID=UPI00136C020F|nr:ComEA family DNA-binding protein [Clostridium sp. C8-1-8]
MKKREKIIGASVMVLFFITFITIGYFNTRQKNLTQKDMEDMFVDVDQKEAKASKGDKKEAGSSKKETTDTDSNTQAKKVVVEIKGEVRKADVYYLDEGSIVKDLITEAGGLTDKADLSSINQAKKLVNNECIVIGSKDKVGTNNITASNKEVSVSSVVSDSGAVVNLNTASKEELDKIPGIGAVTAEKIIEYRQKNNGFKTIDDIKKVDRIGDKLFEKIKDKISVN